MHGLVAVQVAFCFVVLFVAGLFVTSFDRLTHQATGFSAERIVNLETLTQQAQPAVNWDQVAEHLRELPGVQAVAMTTWPMMSGESWTEEIVVNGAPPGDVLSDFLAVSPGWFEEMKIPVIDGREFFREESFPNVAIVNQRFASEFFHGENPVGKSFETIGPKSVRVRVSIVGYVKDARSRDNFRFPVRATAYVPFRSVDGAGVPQLRGRGTFVVRTSGENLQALAPVLREEVAKARPEFYVSNIRTQAEIIRGRTFRERLLAMLGMFFAGVAIVLGGIGLYGVLHYSVVQRRREIGIRLAVGAQPGRIARLVTANVFLMVAVGAVFGLVMGVAVSRVLVSLLFEVKATDWTMMAAPWTVLLLTALVAAIVPVMRAVRIDPVEMLRAE